MDIRGVIGRVAGGRSDHCALVMNDVSWTYAELAAGCERFGSQLLDMGLGAGDRVALFLPNSVAFVLAFHGALDVGCVVVPVHAESTPHELASVVRDSGASVVMTDGRRVDSAATAIGPMNAGVALVVTDTSGRRVPERRIGPCPRVAHPTEHDDIAVLLYTSGTSGEPKGVAFSSEAIARNVSAIAEACAVDPSARLLTFLSLTHSFAQNVVLNTALWSGATAVVLERLDLEHLRHHVSSRRLTGFYGVPSVFDALLRRQREPLPFERIAYFLAAGEHLQERTSADWEQRYGTVIHSGYGLTEAGLVSCQRPGDPTGTGVGLPLRDVEVAILDAGSHGPADVGEIVVRGPSVMTRYWRDEPGASLVKGWLRTGDVGRVGSDGGLQVLGRIKSAIKVDGRSIYPEEVEAVLRDHPEVVEALVFGVPRGSGDVLCANVVTRYGTASTPELRRHCLDHLSPAKVPVRITLVSSLPRSSTGKLRRHRRYFSDYDGAETSS